jgi:hypothetical protein
VDRICRAHRGHLPVHRFFLVKLVYNPYTIELLEDQFFINALCALAVMGIDYLHRERFRQANPNISLGSRFFRYFAVLAFWMGGFIVLSSFLQL